MIGQPRISIEHSHAILDPLNRTKVTVENLRRSAEMAAILKGHLERANMHVETVMLFDDKYLSAALARDNEVAPLLALLDSPPDFTVFESDLKRLAPAFISITSEPQRTRIARQMHAGRRAPLPCSIDIALWHLLRLGVIRPSGRLRDAIADPDEGFDPYDIAVSILPHYEKTYEDKARRENLSAVPSAIADRIEVVYFDRDDPTEDIDSMLLDAAQRIEGKVNAYSAHH
jgi:hypothetical protein